MRADYSITITHRERGVLISLPIYIGELDAICRYYKKTYGYVLIDGMIGQKYNCLCLTSTHGSKIWRDELGLN